MPADGGYGKVALNAPDDERVREAAGLLKCDVAGVCGILALLGGALARDSRSGLLGSDIVAFVGRHGAVRNPSKVAEVLLQVGLIIPRRGKHYLRGWNDLYRPLIERRESNRKAQETWRRKHYGKHPVSAESERERRGEDLESKSTSKASPVPPYQPVPPEDPDPRPQGTAAGSSLPSSALAELSLSGIRLHGRAGVSLHVWTGAIASLLESGASWPDILATLKTSQPCDPPHVALSQLQAVHGSPRPVRGILPPDPRLASKYAAFGHKPNDEAEPETPPSEAASG